MRNLVSIEGAPLDEELAQRHFDELSERARAFLDRLECCSAAASALSARGRSADGG